MVWAQESLNYGFLERLKKMEDVSIEEAGMPVGPSDKIHSGR
jgi:hypothetical protein